MIRSIFLRKARKAEYGGEFVSRTVFARSAIFFCSFLLLVGGFTVALPQTVAAQTEPTPEQRSCLANGTCTCSLRNVGGAEGGITRFVCTQVQGTGTTTSTTTTVVNPTTGGGVTSTENPDGTIRNENIAPRGGGICPFGDFGCWLGKLPGMLFTGIAFLFLMLSSAILFMAGTVFNWVVIRTVFQFGTYFGTNEGMLIAWGVMRDVANIGLLFGFIFMGVLLILNVEGGGGHGHGGGMSAKKAIPRLIIFAVLLNFSLFASQLVIDVANAFSSSFATLAGESCSTNTTSENGAGGATDSNAECANNGIAGKVLDVTGLTKIWSLEEGWDNLLNRPYSYAISLILLSVFVLVTAMVLLAGAIMLVIRVVILSLLMVTSPIGFAGMAIPKLQGIATSWWSKLMSQAFFAPVYLLLIFISIKLTEGLMDGNASLADALIGNKGDTVAGNMQVVMVFLVVIGFMIGSLIAATKMGAMGAKFATSTAAGMTVGAAGFVGRRTVGRASTYAATRIRGSSLGETAMGKRLAGVADYGSKASFSLRNVSSGGLGKLGLDIGKANKDASHGYHGIEEKAVKERVEYAKSLRGPRTETDEEMRARIQYEEASKENEQFNADRDIANATQAGADAAAAQVTAQVNLANQESDVATLRAEAARNPTDEALQAQLIQGERRLAQDTKDLAQADKALVDATNALAAANKKKERADAIAVNTARSTVSEKRRQINYAEGINHTGDNITLSAHANHEAAEQIIKYAGKDELERALDEIKKATKNKNEAGGGSPPPPSGGGPPPPAPH